MLPCVSLFIIILCCSFSFSQCKSSLLFARVGQPVTVSCVFNWKLESTDDVRGFRDNASGGLIELIPGECGDPGSQCRITRTVESNGAVTLTIRDTQRNDSGRYYCAEESGSSLRFSNESVVIVSGVSILAPVAVSGSALDSKATLTLECLIRGLSSLSVRVRWFISGNLVAEGTPSSGMKVKQGGEGQGDRESYAATSRLTILVETWRSGAECACEAQLDRNTSIRSGSVSYAGIHGAASTEDSTHVIYERTPGSGDTKRRDEEDSLVTYASLEFESQKKNSTKKRRI
ncbi:M1-specific T cell receptor beta chain-like [Acipenser oxyrinchus oxyrinchus]|nr:M1-specific T cell receptor beta chain-like [Acipenser oxyrinchus oxyrinchus]